MQLSRNDLAQLDEAYLAGLAEGALRVLSVKLLIDLKEAVERLDQNPRNSSRPPSSRAPWEGAGSQRQETPGQDAERGRPPGDNPESAPPAPGEVPEVQPPKEEQPRPGAATRCTRAWAHPVLGGPWRSATIILEGCAPVAHPWGRGTQSAR